MGDLKKADLLSALADIDGAAEQLIEDIRLGDQSHPGIQLLDRARFWPEPVRLAVDAIRKERGDIDDEGLLHEKARRLHREFTHADHQPPSWEVRDWREAERLETGERVFEVMLLGIDLPEKGEELIPLQVRGDKLTVGGLPTDFCECGHTRGSHNANGACSIDEVCGCKQFRLLAAGVEGAEELPRDPHPELTIQSASEEGNAITFIRQLVGAAGLDEPDPELWMALQRLLSQGWRVVPPKDQTEEH